MRLKKAFYGIFPLVLSMPVACYGTLNKECDVDALAIELDIQGKPATAPKLCFLVGEQERCFYLFLPDCAKQEKDVPLVVDLHDRGSCPLVQSRISGWKEYAMSECFVVAWPLGTTNTTIADEPCFTVPGGREVLNGNGVHLGTTPDCCCMKDGSYITASETNDLDFIRTLISVAIEQASYNDIAVNTTAVKMTGLGNGATAAIGYTAFHSDMVSCLASFSGAIVTPFSELYVPVPTISVVDSGKSYEDEEVTISASTDDGSDIYLIPSASRTDGYFSAANQCAGERSARSNVARETIYGTEGTVTAGKFQDCAAPVNFLNPPYAPYKARNTSNIYPDDTQTANRVVDSTLLTYFFCHGKRSVNSAYAYPDVEVIKPSSSRASSANAHFVGGVWSAMLAAALSSVAVLLSSM